MKRVWFTRIDNDILNISVSVTTTKKGRAVVEFAYFDCDGRRHYDNIHHDCNPIAFIRLAMYYIELILNESPHHIRLIGAYPTSEKRDRIYNRIAKRIGVNYKSLNVNKRHLVR